MVKKKIILLVLYFLQFYLTSLLEKEYFAKLNQQSGARAVFFGPLGAGANRKKIPGAGAVWEKDQEPEPLEKKVRSRRLSRLKIWRLPSPGLKWIENADFFVTKLLNRVFYVQIATRFILTVHWISCGEAVLINKKSGNQIQQLVFVQRYTFPSEATSPLNKLSE